ncbi:MAG: DUF72 domain-containing protein, partial [Candidatus Nitrosopolaris sp.]
MALLIQLPPSLQIHEGLERLREIAPKLDARFKYAVEVRHNSWFQDSAYNFFVIMIFVWSGVGLLKYTHSQRISFICDSQAIEAHKKRILAGSKWTEL